jgi:hypothetical protein
MWFVVVGLLEQFGHYISEEDQLLLQFFKAIMILGNS